MRLCYNDIVVPSENTFNAIAFPLSDRVFYGNKNSKTPKTGTFDFMIQSRRSLVTG